MTPDPNSISSCLHSASNDHQDMESAITRSVLCGHMVDVDDEDGSKRDDSDDGEDEGGDVCVDNYSRFAWSGIGVYWTMVG